MVIRILHDHHHDLESFDPFHNLLRGVLALGTCAESSGVALKTVTWNENEGVELAQKANVCVGHLRGVLRDHLVYMCLFPVSKADRDSCLDRENLDV